ncbi:MAG: ATP-dependent Clp protease ATP-binding subunit [Geitlerinemataceae cyanobacterium]
MFEQFTDKAIRVVMLAQEESRRLGHNMVGTEQLLLGLLGEGRNVAAKVLEKFEVTRDEAREEVEQIVGRGSGLTSPEIPFTPKAKRVLENAVEESRQLGNNYIAPEHILLGLTRDENGVAVTVLENLGVDRAELRTQVMRELGEMATSTAGGSSRRERKERGDSKTSTLDEFGTNWTQAAIDGKLDPVVGRANETERVIQILGRRTKNNPVLIGEPGIGKTAIAEGLAQRIAQQDVPEGLLDKQVISLEMGTLVAGTRYRGEFEERLKNILSEVKAAGNVILAIDEIHTLAGAGGIEGGLDAANLMKPALARGEIQCIGATTLDEYRKYIEKDAALERRFQPVMVGEPTVEETIEILTGLRDRYEQHHQLTISDEALEAAASLADRYINDRFLPDKAIDLIDEAGSRVHIRHYTNFPASRELKKEIKQVIKDKEQAVDAQDFKLATELRDRERDLRKKIEEGAEGVDASAIAKPTVTEEDIASIVASWTGVPVTKVTETESEKLLHIEDTLHERLIGQEDAVRAVSKAIRRARVGLKNPNRPIASFIFSGPTGVGKTELTKALADYFFGSEEAMIRLDMSEYMERYTVSKLIGSPPGYVGYDEGGQLTEAVRRKPYSVVLFDEIEKAHPDVFNLLLQILEDGRLSDTKGRVVDFKNTLIILTSNLGARAIEKGGGGLGFEFDDDREDAQYNRIRNLVNEELKQFFRPEFLNRLDDIIVFQQLKRDEVQQIAEILLKDVEERLADREITLEMTERFKERVVADGFDPAYGARPLRRAISRLLEDALAEALLSGRVEDGDTATIDVDEDGNVTVSRGSLADSNVPELAGVGY